MSVWEIALLIIIFGLAFGPDEQEAN